MCLYKGVLVVSESSTPQPGVESVEIRGTVKWFNVVKGYGFLTPDDGSDDVFLHLTVLRNAGHDRLLPGTTVQAEAVKGAKGMQVLRVCAIDESTAVADPSSARPASGDVSNVAPQGTAEGPFISGTVKWFNPHKGYGFICPQNDTSMDIFVHMVTLRRSGITELVTGQIVEFRAAEGPKGQQATDVRLISGTASGDEGGNDGQDG